MTDHVLKQLKNFDPKLTYPTYDGMIPVSSETQHIQKDIISNLITDMTTHGARVDEFARAVRHSMVVIDAEKHNLNWKQSAIDHGIAQLTRKYQGDRFK